MSDTDGSLYGGDSMDELITTASTANRALASISLPESKTPKKYGDFLAHAHMCPTSTPIMDTFLMTKSRSLSLSNLTICEFNEKSVSKHNEWFNVLDSEHLNGEEVEDSKAIVQRLRLERTMPEYECNRFGENGERYMRQEAARKIQQCMIVHSYRKVKQQAQELKEKLDVVQNLHETTMLKLKVSKAEADIERARAMSNRRDLAAALNQLDEQERISDVLKEEVGKLRDQSLNLQAQCHKLDATVHDRDTTLTGLQTELTKQKEQLNKAEAVLNERDAAEVGKLRDQSLNLQAQCHKLDATVHDRDTTLTGLQTELTKQKEQLNKAEAVLNERDAAAQAMAVKMSELEQKVEDLLKRVEAAEEQNQAYAADMAKKEEELDVASMTIQELNEEKEDLEGILKNVKDEMEDVKEDLSRQMATEEELVKTIDMLNKSVAHYAEYNDNLGGNLKLTRAENFDLKKHIIEQHMIQEHVKMERNKKSVLFRGALGVTGFFVKAVIVALMPYQTSFIVHNI